MSRFASRRSSVVKIAVMGATGTGKSTFINLLANDKKIRIGHNPESETSDIQTAHYTDQKTGRSVMLIDTPGFDDCREGVTDTDILEKIVRFLEPESGEGQRLNGILYLHRISDPRVGSVSRQNLRMFQALCGEKAFPNVFIVTTFWDYTGEEVGRDRQSALEQGAFKSLLDAGARMRRHANTVDSAQRIISELIPLPPVTTQIQEELQAGVKLEDTAAGTVLTMQIRELQKKHAQELAYLKEAMEEAWKARDFAGRAELEELLEARMVADGDRRRLQGGEKPEDTADGSVLTMQIRELQKRRVQELVNLKREMEEASQAHDSALRAQFEEERKVLEERVVIAEEDRRKLQCTLDHAASAGKAVGFIGGLTSSLFGTAVSPAVAIFGP